MYQIGWKKYLRLKMFILVILTDKKLLERFTEKNCKKTIRNKF